MRPCPSSGFEPLKELPRKRLSGEGARGCSGPRSALASLQQPLAVRETVGSPSSPPPAWGWRGMLEHRAGVPSERKLPETSQRCLLRVRACWHQGTGGTRLARAWGEGLEQGMGPGYPGLGRGMWDQPWGGHRGRVQRGSLPWSTVGQSPRLSTAGCTVQTIGQVPTARHGSALQGTCLSTTWLSAEHCGAQLAWLGTAGRDLALHNSTRCCVAQLTSAQCGLLWHGAAHLSMVLNRGHSSARHGLAQHGSA